MPEELIHSKRFTVDRDPILWPCDTRCGSGFPRSDYEHGKFQIMPDGVDRVSKDEVFQTTVPMSSHNDEIRTDFPGIADYLPLWRRRMANRCLNPNSQIAKVLRNPLEVLLTRFHLRSRSLFTVKLAGDTLLDV